MTKAPPLRVALLADTHGCIDQRVRKEVAACDFAVHAGDIGNAAVLQSLQPKLETLAVRGNNDTPARWPSSGHDVLARLPESQSLALPGGLLVVTHGHRAGGPGERHSRLRRQFPQARAIVYGHSHRLVCDQEGPIWVLNPGAAGRARTYGGPSCLILLAGSDGWRIEVMRFSAPARR